VQLGSGAREAAGAREGEESADVAQIVNHRPGKFVIIFTNY
jgi:hypothetical protein